MDAMPLCCKMLQVTLVLSIAHLVHTYWWCVTIIIAMILQLFFLKQQMRAHSSYMFGRSMAGIFELLLHCEAASGSAIVAMAGENCAWSQDLHAIACQYAGVEFLG